MAAMNTSPSCNRSGLALFGLILALGLIVSSFIFARSLMAIKSASQMITVKGYAERRIDSDLVVWRGSFAITSKDLVSGYAALEANAKRVQGYLEGKGLTKEAIAVSAASTETLYTMADGVATNTIEGYRLSQTVTVKSSDVALIDRLSKESSELIRDNIAWSSETPEYYYTKVDTLKVEMLGEAAKDAKRRAEQLAESSGNRVGVLRSAQQGVFQITAENSASVSDYGEYDTGSMRKSIKAVVTMQYSVS